MEKEKRKRKKAEEDRPPSSPVCYANTEGLRPGFETDEGIGSDMQQGGGGYRVATKPEAVVAIFAEAWMQRDAKYLATLFDSKAEFVNVVGLWWHNREDIEKAHAYGLKVIFKDSKLAVVKTKVKYLSDTIAVVHAKMKLSGQTHNASNEKQTATRHNLFTFVVQRFSEDQWVCVAAQNTEIIAGAETFVRNLDGSIYPADYRKT